MLGKLFGGGLGFVLGGPIGAIVGVALGHSIDNLNFGGGLTTKSDTAQGDFEVSLLVLSAAVMKADGRVMKSELEYVSNYFMRWVGEEKTKGYMKLLRDILKQDLSIRQICHQIRLAMPHEQRLQMLQYLFEIASADGNVDHSEVRTIRTMASYLGINNRDYLSLQAMFYTASSSDYSRSYSSGRSSTTGRYRTGLSQAYVILESKSSDSDQDLKNAYRRLAKKFHPDRVAALGPDHQDAAKEKFQKLQEAWEVVKESRGMN